MLNKELEVKVKKESKMKNLIVTAHKIEYYIASALINTVVKEADIEFSKASSVAEDLAKYVESPYENIYLVGLRLLEEHKNTIKNSLAALTSAKKKVFWYALADRFHLEEKDMAFFRKYIREPEKGKDLLDVIKTEEKVSDENFKRLNTIYKLNQKDTKDTERDDVLDWVKYTYEQRFDWQFEDGNPSLVEMIKKLAENNITENDMVKSAAYSFTGRSVIYKSDVMKTLMKKVQMLKADKYISVLITGESGTGKDVIAEKIQSLSGRAGAYRIMNCAAVTESLMEAKLFGYKKGAFTGADRDAKGIFEEAEGGTVFLDEISEMSLSLQAKLLRVLENFSVTPLGEHAEKKVDVRIICATNKNIYDQEKFREDLAYRISGIELKIPPLRERPEDIPLLAMNFLIGFARLGHARRVLDSKEIKLMQNYTWPGNARQLLQFLNRVLLLKAVGKDFEKMIEEMPPVKNSIKPATLVKATSGIMTMEEAEKSAIQNALEKTGNNKSDAAKALDIALNTLKSKMDKFGIS